MSNGREKEVILKKAIVFVSLKIFLLVEAAPNLNPKSWNVDDLSQIISPPCSTNEPCWNWIPMMEASDSPFTPHEDPKMQAPRIQSTRGTNSGLMSWHGAPEKIETIDRLSIPVPYSSGSQFPNRLSKKDVFMSRGWGAGGMPFSVLYMNPHNSRPVHGTPSVSNSGDASKSDTSIKNTEIIPIPSKNTQQNYRIAPRNGQASQSTRRQYSIIPQLFISYGWGPSGK